MDPQLKEYIIVFAQGFSDLRHDLTDLYRAQGLSQKLAELCAESQLAVLDNMWRKILRLVELGKIEEPVATFSAELDDSVRSEKRTPGELAAIFKARCKDYDKTEDKVE